MSTYSTSSDIRSEAGLQSNVDIADSVIDGFRIQSNAQVKSAVASRYNIKSLEQNFSGSQAEQLLKRAEILLGAGYLLIKAYGNDDTQEDSEGIDKLKLGEAILKEIQVGKLLLIDSNGSEYNYRGSRISIAGYPNGGSNDPESVISIDEKF